jgi:hypothetical protein
MLKNNYVKVNARFSNPFLFCITNRGFYSEVNNLLNAILYGLVAKRRLSVDQSSFADGGLVWADLYRSQLPWSSGEISSSNDLMSVIAGVESSGFDALGHLIMSWHQKRRFFLSRTYGFYKNVYAAKRHLASHFLQPLQHTECPGPLQEPYEAIHVRRGDKLHGYMHHGTLRVEGEDISARKYLQIIRRVTPNIRKLFIMTDDYQAVEKFRAIAAHMDIVSFCEKADHGYDQGQFSSLPSRTKTVMIRQLILEAELASRSQIFVGCYSSNVSRYIALIHRKPKSCYSVDSVEDWSPC